MSELEIGFMVINWLIAILMLTGTILIQATKYDLKHRDMEDVERKTNEIFLNIFYDNNISGKLFFIMSIGARFWSIVLFYNIIKEDD